MKTKIRIRHSGQRFFADPESSSLIVVRLGQKDYLATEFHGLAPIKHYGMLVGLVFYSALVASLFSGTVDFKI
jgi:hypothetical protein